jgi:hypothetical protein
MASLPSVSFSFDGSVPAPVTFYVTEYAFLTGSSLHLYNAEAFTRFLGGFDIYASEPLTPSCFLFKQ